MDSRLESIHLNLSGLVTQIVSLQSEISQHASKRAISEKKSCKLQLSFFIDVGKFSVKEITETNLPLISIELAYLGWGFPLITIPQDFIEKILRAKKLLEGVVTSQTNCS